MSRELNQARGFAAQMTMGFETVYNTAATAGTTFAHNGSTLQGGRELNNSDTILPNRSPAEPFHGNATVDGGIVLPNDSNQLAVFLKAAFGAPVTTNPADSKGLSAVADATEGKCKFTVASGHGVTAGAYFTVYGTTNYNGEYQAITADATSVTVRKTYIAETFSGSAYVTREGFKHTFKIRPAQPSVTIEQLHTDLAESLVYTGCKVSRMVIGADSNGQENVVSFDFMGSKMLEVKEPLKISAFASGSSSNTKVTATGHDFVNGDRVVIAGSVNYNGVWVISGKATDTFEIDTTYTAEAITPGGGSEPVCCKAQIKAASIIPLKRLNTFSAVVYKDGAEYKAARNKEITFDFGLDGEQRVIGDKGFRSEIPEGQISVETGLTVLVKNADWVRAGQENITTASKLIFEPEFGLGKLEIDLPENKTELTGIAVEGPAGLVQQIRIQAFCSDGSAEGSAATITLTNSMATI